VTGPPIYLVSACATGDEFVAAFRRYADKNGLFVPIAEPLAVGCRARFAVTLRDGGVMIEGEAEVISAARAPSVLHGRVGMTLRFLHLDEPSKITLSELEKARLAMKPAPPSVPPRPATLPAEPRAVPPPVQGRVDAVNALAECVAIGPAELLGPRVAPATVPPKAGPKFVMPPIASGAPAATRATPPAPVPAAVLDPGPTSDTMVAVAPPVAPSLTGSMAIPRTSTRPGPAPAPPPSAPGLRISELAAAVERAPAGEAVYGAPAQPAAESPLAIVASTPARYDESARTQIHAGAPPPEPSVAPRRTLVSDIEIAEPTDMSLAPTAPEPRKTALGIAVAVDGAPSDITPIAISRSLFADDAAGEETTGEDSITIDSDLDPELADEAEPSGSPAPELAPMGEDRTPLEPWPPDAGKPEGPVVPGGALPSGDWTIALDPAAPDGWSPPLEPRSGHDLADGSLVARPSALGVEARPLAISQRLVPRSEEMPIAEPKVQIDPTLIEPLIVPIQGSFHDVPLAAAMYGSAVDPQSMGHTTIPGVAIPPPGSFVTPHGQLLRPAEAPAYGLDPGYQMVAVANPPSLAPGDSFGDPRYADDTAVAVRTGRRRAIIVFASAVVVVVAGIAAVAVLTGKSAATSGQVPALPAPPRAAPAPTAPAPTAPSPSAPAPSAPAPRPPSPAAASGAAPATEAVAAPALATGECFADISSVPSGAEIVLDQRVLGTTPRKVKLPCGGPVELVFRKGRLAPVARMITPTPQGAKLKVTLARQSFLVKVSSTPEGATITLNGKPLGVTPTTVKLPAFESSALKIAKDGYETDTETVAPKASGSIIRAQLKKLDR